MQPQDTLMQLAAYKATWIERPLAYGDLGLSEEEQCWQRLVNFIKKTPQAYNRTHTAGHLTGSALITNATLTRVLLTKHRKIGKWLQLGGHADGDTRIWRVAEREGVEESGLAHLNMYPLRQLWGEAEEQLPLPFDIDIHTILANQKDIEHYHYDIRFLFIADDTLTPVRSEESSDLKWLSLDKARQLTQERSMLRQFDKLEYIGILKRSALL